MSEYPTGPDYSYHHPSNEPRTPDGDAAIDLLSRFEEQGLIKPGEGVILIRNQTTGEVGYTITPVKVIPDPLTRKLVRYTCEFEAAIEYDPQTEDLQDAFSDIDIPEGGKNNSRYIENTFCVLDTDDPE